ncbi:MAG: TetR family transcriptional regulator [Bacteroidales bacterium]|nr:TetR family transcriptional regulator [Bacteroidales bacterium]
MSIHLLINIIMRVIDTDKIERIKKEAKILIVNKGYHGASIAEIAKKANVSDGYLYRHYKNKSELVKDILEKQLEQFHDHIFALLDEKQTLKSVLDGIISFLFNLSQEEPYAITFAHMLVYDHEFVYPQSRHDAINKLSKDLLNLGIKNGEISQTTREIDIQLTILNIPVKFIEYNSKGYYENYLTEKKEKELLINLCMNALK